MPLLLSRDELKPLLDLDQSHRVDRGCASTTSQWPDRAPCAVSYARRRRAKDCASFPARCSSNAASACGWGPTADWAAAIKCTRLLFDADSGELLSFMGFPFGTLRTAAVVAIAAKHMAREDSKKLGLFGVGRNAFGILKALQTGAADQRNLCFEPRSRAAQEILRGGRTVARHHRARRRQAGASGARHGCHSHRDQFVDADLSRRLGRAGHPCEQHGQTDGVGPRLAFESQAHRGRQPRAGAQLRRSDRRRCRWSSSPPKENFPGAESRSWANWSPARRSGAPAATRSIFFANPRAATAIWRLRRGFTMKR